MKISPFFILCLFFFLLIFQVSKPLLDWINPSFNFLSVEQSGKVILSVNNFIIWDPWLNGFPYRRAVTVNNTQNTNTLTDYQVLVTLDTASLISAGKMQSDCGDIRFTDSDGTTLLSYWLESGCNTTFTQLWVKVPSIPASSTKTIYVYYGNPSASSESNGDAVFEFFDDFNSLNTTKWNAYRASGDTTNELSIENGVIYLTRAVDGKGGLLVSKGNITPPFIVKFRYKAGGGDGADGIAFGYLMNDPGGASCGGRLGFPEGAGYYGYLIQLDNYQNPGDPYANYIGINNITDGIEGDVDGSAYQTSATEDNLWHIIEAALTEDEILWVKLDGSTIISSDTTPASTGYYKIGLGAGTGGLNNNHIIDYLRIRKYTSPEPSVSIGAEEPSPIPRGITVPKGSATNWQWYP